MTRPIRRGYPWPAHGRDLAQVVRIRKWGEIVRDLEDFMRHMSSFFAVMSGGAGKE